jgi:micrococcal nuclease
VVGRAAAGTWSPAPGADAAVKPGRSSVDACVRTALLRATVAAVRRLSIILAALTATAALAGAGPARAATCADFSDQAGAQHAANTRDGDGDGIYCEALPCPCARGGSGGGTAPPPQPVLRKPARRIPARITSVVDGDTIHVRAADRSYTVRLIGIDSPESHRPGRPVECGARRATAEMRRLAFAADGRGRRVTLMTDPTQATYDRYGRLLAYVDTISGVDLQAAMLRSGLATVYVYHGKPFQRLARFRKAQSQARVSTRGVYSQCDGDFHGAR